MILMYVLGFRRQFPIFARRVTHVFLENAIEVLRILKSQLVSNFADAFVGPGNQLFGHSDQFVLYVFLRRLARLFFDKVAEIVGREEYAVGKILDGRQPFALRLPALEIVVEQRLETAQRVVLDSVRVTNWRL